ncbi:MAG: O-acetyl-ADP-ribose deacetylase, partial [Sediminispirochaetaceae bacterium]
MAEFFEGRLIVQTGDITAMQVEAVVNAANSSLMGGGGVDGAIHRRGGPSILDECREIRSHQYPEGLPAGKAVITGGGSLPAAHVIHTVGPVWHGGNRNEDATLAQAYANSLQLASETGIKTIAFPAISTGVYGFPKARAARIVFQTVGEFIRHHNLPRT